MRDLKQKRGGLKLVTVREGARAAGLRMAYENIARRANRRAYKVCVDGAAVLGVGQFAVGTLPMFSADFRRRNGAHPSRRRSMTE